MEKNQEKIKKENIINNEFNLNKNNEESTGDLFFYIMTLQTDNGENHEIKIYENSNASELAFNFCKNYNLDFSTMKYLKKCIKQIIQQIKDNKNRQIVYILKDNNSIQEVAEEEIITDNSLKKSGTIKKNNRNSNNNNTFNNNTKIIEEKEEEKNIHKNNSKYNNISEINKNEFNSNNINLNLKEKIFKDNKEENNINFIPVNKKENIIYEYDFIKNNKNIENDDFIEQKDYSIDYCLDNDSIEIFSPTEHTTKIEQKSTLRNNSSSLTKISKYDKYIFDKKNYSKNKKLHNNKNMNYNGNKTYNRHNYSANYKKIKKEANLFSKKSIQNEFKLNNKKNLYIKQKSFNNNIIRKKTQSVEKSRKNNNKKPLLELSHNNKKLEMYQQNKQKYKIKYEKFMTNMNEMKNKYFSNYYNYFLKSKNICNNNLSINNINQKYQTSSSINQGSNKSKSISQNKNKITKNMTQKSFHRNNIKKEKQKSITKINSKAYKNMNMNNSSKINLNTIFLKKEEKQKQKSISKNKIKSNYNMTYANNALYKRNINKNKNSSSFNKAKGSKGKELYIKKNNTNKNNGIQKMFTSSLLNIHKIKDFQDNTKQSIATDRVIKGLKGKNIKNIDLFNKLFGNESNIEKNININDKLYYDILIKTINNRFNSKNKRNNTDFNFIKREYCLKKE